MGPHKREVDSVDSCLDGGHDGSANLGKSLAVKLPNGPTCSIRCLALRMNFYLSWKRLEGNPVVIQIEGWPSARYGGGLYATQFSSSSNSTSSLFNATK